jgi:hypothetical protein
MKNYTTEELADIISKHGLWLQGADGGERANLSGADLSDANLSGADLRGANLRGANLRVREVKGVLKDKHERIEAFSVHPENAKFHVDPDEPTHAAFIDQAEAYPLTKHDDLLDAVSGACECALAHYQRQGDRSTRGSGDNPPRQRPRAPKVAL